MTTAAPRVFISYSRSDRARVSELAAALEQQGCAVWWDAHIEGGSAFAQRIEENLEKADVVLVVWSASAVVSDWVRDEAGHGRDRKRLVPVSFDGTSPPLGFRQYHVIDLSRWKGDADGLSEVMRGIASATGAPVPEPVKQQAAKRRLDRRKALAAGGVAVLAGAGGVAWWAGLLDRALPNSVAVLPFKNISGDASQDYFPQGLSEEVRTALARVPNLQIAAPASVSAFRDRQVDAKEIGRKLDVAYILEGSVRRAGDVARISAELTETGSGFSRWSQSFDRKLDDVFAVQSEIARVITEALSLRVNIPAIAKGGTRVSGAYDAYLRGIALYASDGGEASQRAALAQFIKAADLDEKFALACAYAAMMMTTVANSYASSGEARELYASGKEQAAKAVELAPDAAEAQLSLGISTVFGDRRVKDALPAYEKAYRIGSGDSRIATPYSLFSSYLGRHEAAIEAATHASRLDPLNAATFRSSALAMYYARRFDEAEPLFRKSLEIKPDLRNSHGYLGFIALERGRREEAGKEFAAEQQELLARPGRAMLAHLSGDTAAAQAELAALVAKMGDNSLVQQAQVLAQWGDTDRALGALEKAMTAGDAGLLSLRVNPLFDPLRQQPRFSALLNRLGLA